MKATSVPCSNFDNDDCDDNVVVVVVVAAVYLAVVVVAAVAAVFPAYAKIDACFGTKSELREDSYRAVYQARCGTRWMESKFD